MKSSLRFHLIFVLTIRSIDEREERACAAAQYNHCSHDLSFTDGAQATSYIQTLWMFNCLQGLCFSSLTQHGDVQARRFERTIRRAGIALLNGRLMICYLSLKVCVIQMRRVAIACGSDSS